MNFISFHFLRTVTTSSNTAFQGVVANFKISQQKNHTGKEKCQNRCSNTGTNGALLTSYSSGSKNESDDMQMVLPISSVEQKHSLLTLKVF